MAMVYVCWNTYGLLCRLGGSHDCGSGGDSRSGTKLVATRGVAVILINRN